MGSIDKTKAAFKGSNSLQELIIYDCGELTCLPEGVLQPTLLEIFIRRCPKLITLNPIDEIEGAFNGSMSLQQLVIDDCPELITLPEGVLHPTILSIDIPGCPKLKTLTPIDESKAAFNGSMCLQQLGIYDCPELITLPGWVLQPTLIDIDIRRCPKLKMLNPIDKIAAAFNSLTSLRRLWIYDCPELTLPAFKGSTSLEELIINGCTELTCLPEGVLQPTLMEIDIRGCPKLKTLTPIDESKAAFNGSMCLQKLHIYDCPELITLPAWVLQPTLTDIDIRQCPKLTMLNPIDKIAAAFNNLTSLRRLCISDCPKLTLQEAAFKGSSSLEKLTISGFTELTCLPEGVLQPTLIEIRLRYCPKLKTPDPDALRTLTSLKVLAIRSCSNWGSCWEEGLFCTNSLQVLWIGEFGEDYRYFPWPSTSTAASPPSTHLTSLEKLCLYGWPEVKSLPDQLEHLPALRYLEIWNFSGLESLPEWLRKLSSLESLSIHRCPLLGKSCEKGSGEDWRKIAHIPSIEIDGRRIE